MPARVNSPAPPQDRPDRHRQKHAPCALAIGGLDPGGGAGIAADLRAFAAADVFGCAAIAVITVQSTHGLRSARALDSREVLAQVREVTRYQRVRAFKLGALGSIANVRAVGRFLARHSDIPAVVDPVMVPTRGRARLLDRGAVEALQRWILPHTTLLTANAPEAEVLTGSRIRTIDDASRAAEQLRAMGARAVLVKGGHLEGRDAIDVLAASGAIHLLRARRIPSLSIHGGGCVLASLIAGRIASATTRPSGAHLPVTDGILVDAVHWAKQVHRAALSRTWNVDQLDQPSTHTKSSVEPAPSRKTSGGVLVKSMTVLGIIPPAPESITKARP